ISMVDFSKVMVHNVRGSENPSENEQKAIDALQDSLITIFTNRTSKSKAEITEMMNNETWLNAKEALDAGFIDNIISSKHKETEKRKKQIQSKFEIVNILNLNKSENMKNLCKYLGLNEDASESAILDAVKKINDELSIVKGKLETKDSELVKADETIKNQKATIKGFEDKQTELNETLVNETIDKAEKDGLIDEKDKEAIKEEFKNNLVGLKLIVGKLKTPAQIITNQLKADEGSSEIPEGRKDWGLRKWEEEDSKGIEEIKTNNVELYNEMYKAEYGIELTA
ncbi:MAG: ATP-dependent Clp protease proteolytic subunit, partial [Candidatus Anammoxibacter sp.]